MKHRYKRTLEELEYKAVLHWPAEILHEVAESSILPLLLQTQDSFLSIIKCASKTPMSWEIALQNCKELNSREFLKHLMTICDIGGEALNKLPPLSQYISDAEMVFDWKGERYSYRFQRIGKKCSLSNSSLKVSGHHLVEDFSDIALDPRHMDVCMLLLYGSQLVNDSLPMEIKEKCVLGEYIGQPHLLEEFVRKRYIFVSRQSGGSTSNALGQIAQKYVARKLAEILGEAWSITSNGTLPNVSHTGDDKLTNFDIVAQSPSEKYYGIEVSFQVTTNSVIERKVRESEALMRSVHRAGHKICYVIDGAGNIKIRRNAVGILCGHSDCTVALSPPEIQHLANFLLSGE